MHFVMMENVPVLPNIRGIHTLSVDLNVSLVQIVQEIKLVCVKNVQIPAPALVVKGLFVMSLITRLCAVVRKVLLEMHLSTVDQHPVFVFG
jgi:hypothetical protein